MDAGGRDRSRRLPRFARDFFARLFDAFPKLKAEVVLLRWSEQPDDVYAFFDRQIDPHLEYVIIFGRDSRGEHGDWGGNDRTQEALDYVREILGTAA